jgi:hypothetical protein
VGCGQWTVKSEEVDRWQLTVKSQKAKSEIQNMKCCEKENADSETLKAKLS